MGQFSKITTRSAKKKKSLICFLKDDKLKIYLTKGYLDQFRQQNIPPYALDVLLAKLVLGTLVKVKFP